MARHVVNATAGKDHVEASRRQRLGHRSRDPVDVNLTSAGKSPRLFETLSGEVDTGDHATQLGEEDAVAALSTPEVEHVVTGPHEAGDVDREGRRVGPEDI